MKFLIAGLGNPGAKYQSTRHNIGFDVLDHLARIKEATFSEKRYGFVTQTSHRGRKLILLKPNTYMNLSGKAIRYWTEQENIPLDRLLVITDDVHLPVGKLRVKNKGSSGGHNGLEDINQKLQTGQYPRMRVGVGGDYSKGKQVEYVLSQWTPEQAKVIEEVKGYAADAVLSFAYHGSGKTMSYYNALDLSGME